MAGHDPKAARAGRFDPERALAAVVREPVDEALERVADISRAEVELTMADLISDDNGEVVFYNDSGFRSLALRTDSAVVANGLAAPHVTAGGEDVTGFHYVTFENGLTLYYQEGLDLVLSGCEPGPS